MSNSIGDLKNSGLKGNNWPWQYKMLKGLQGIIDVISSTANGSEYEAQLVNIDCPDPLVPPAPHAGTKLYLEVRTWDTVTGGFTNISYYLPGSDTAYPAVDFAGCTVTYLNASTTPLSITPNFITSSADPATAITDAVYSISFFNNGSVPALVSFDAGVSFEIIPAGVTINMDAGDNNNIYAANIFEYDTVTADPNGSLVITYNS